MNRLLNSALNFNLRPYTSRDESGRLILGDVIVGIDGSLIKTSVQPRNLTRVGQLSSVCVLEVHLYTLTASSSLAWPFVLCRIASAQFQRFKLAYDI